MSFRDNLQHLRATRNMTQEQLAMLLGVSRQSVTKWEAEKSYPEMDKLLKLCRLFDCTLDDLVQGDLTAREPEPAASMLAAAAPTDVCGYDEHWRKLARDIATGVSIVVASVGLNALLDGMFESGLLAASASVAEALPATVMFAFIALALAFLIPAGIRHTSFKRAHPYVEDFYSQTEKDETYRHGAIAIVAGVAIIFAGLCAQLFMTGTAWDSASGGVFLLVVAVALWPLVHWGMLMGRVNVAEYNRSAAEDVEIEDIMHAELEDALKERLIAKRRSQRMIGSVCGIIMLISTIVGLLLLFGPVLASPDPDNFDPAGTPTAFFWLAWVVGGICCGIATLIINCMARE